MKNFVALAFVIASACARAPAPAPAAKPWILLVTLDTTRFDSIGPDAKDVQTPAFDAIAARGRRYLQAYAAVPETLPSHSSIMTGLYPGGHGVHENARYLPANLPVLAEQLQKAGYRTSAFVSSFILARRFGLARGFDLYDDALPPGANERSSRATTDAAIAELARPLGAEARSANAARFVWVHYYDAHAPYDPPEPYLSRYRAHPYLGEIAAMDEQLGRLVHEFQRRASGPTAIIVVADHGEGLGEHGEAQHGSLLYQATMHVPLVIVGPGIDPGTNDTPVSTRRVYHTVLDWAGVDAALSLRGAGHEARGVTEVVLGEAMKPFLEYGWQPQIMAVTGHYKAILAGKVETYDVAADPGERHDLGSGAALPAGVRKALEDYPVPSPSTAGASELDEDAKRRLASLGYVSSGAVPVVRKDAPRPANMTATMDVIERASGLFADGRYKESIPLFERVLAADPHNIDAALRLASAHSALGENAKAIQMFQRAAEIDPDSQDVRTYLGLHYLRVKDWDRAVTLLERVVKVSPDRATAVEGLAAAKAKQGELSMEAGKTDQAIADFERARALQPSAFAHDLDLGVLYLAAHRFEESRAALDRFLTAHPDDPMGLFKRAQVSVLLKEPDAPARVELARKKADAVTRPLIDRERLFR